MMDANAKSQDCREDRRSQAKKILVVAGHGADRWSQSQLQPVMAAAAAERRWRQPGTSSSGSSGQPGSSQHGSLAWEQPAWLRLCALASGLSSYLFLW